jgi:hypothetical protein
MIADGMFQLSAPSASFVVQIRAGEIGNYLRAAPLDRLTVSGLLQPVAALPGGAACLRNRIRWYSQPIATSTNPKHMNDSAR